MVEIYGSLENKAKKRKIKERMDYLKAKRDNIRLRTQLEKLNNFTKKNNSRSKINDRSFNGAVPMHISK